MTFYHTNPPPPPMPPQNGPPGNWSYHRAPGYWEYDGSVSPLQGYGEYENQYSEPASPKGGNGTRWLSLIQKVQKGLSVIETVGPLIQKYGPIVQNMPALLSMLKELNQQGEDPFTEEDGEPDEHEALMPAKSEPKPTSKLKIPDKPKKSRPKLYI